MSPGNIRSSTAGRRRLRLLAAVGRRVAAMGGDAGERVGAWDGLGTVKASRFDTVQLLPGADFRGYTKVLIDPAAVAFRKNWLRSMNEAQGSRQRITEADAARIATSMRSGFEELFAAAFRDAGFEIATTAGPEVLRLSPAVNDIYINAPDALSDTGGRVYTLEAGEATLVVEARDSTTGALLGRAVDRRDARAFGPITLTNDVTNASDFRQLFRRWAELCVKGLEELRRRAPPPAH